MISLIWAMTKQRVIGKENRIPWHIKEDLLYYKTCTAGKTVFMGETTYYSLKGYYKNRPLPYGKIYVASFNPNLKLEDAVLVLNAEEFLRTTKEDVWVVGGASIYALALPYANYLYISWIQKDYEGDTYFPDFDFTKFKILQERKTDLVVYSIYERV